MQISVLIPLILNTAKVLIGFVRDVADNDEALQEIVDNARAEGREVSKQDVQDAVIDMSLEVDRLEALLAPKSEDGTVEGGDV